MLFTIFFIISLAQTSKSFECNNAENVRLVGGSRNGEGRLEVLGSSGYWGSVCPDGWTSRSSGVVCEELCNERKYASSVPAKGRFGPISNQIRIFDTNCDGYENTLLNCTHFDKNDNNCFEDTAVGICCHSGCDGRNLFLAPRLRYSASCNFKNYTVTVQYPGPGPDGTVRPFSLSPINNPNCGSQITGANTTHNWLTVPYIGDCGVSTYESDSDLLKYKHQVLIQGQSTGPSISRYYQYVLPITCGVNRYANKTEWLDTSRPNGTLDQLPHVKDTLNLDMIIKVFKNPELTEELSTPVKLPVGTSIYVQLSVEKDKLSGGTIIVEDCVAKPYIDAVITHTLITKQKAVSGDTDIFKSPLLNEVRFKMETFKITGHKELYLSCFAYLCTASDTSQRCKNEAAVAQHTQNATRSLSRSKGRSSNDKSKGGSIGVQSPGYEILKPQYKSSPIYTQKQLRGLGEDDEVRIGEDNKCYHIHESGLISLYHAPKNTRSSGKGKTENGKAGEECLNQ